MDNANEATKRFRSPPYPAIGLGKSVERVQQLYQKALHHQIGVPVLADAWGYGEKSSALFATAAALIQFGLLSDDGSGTKRKFSLTDTALRIIKDADPASKKRLDALQNAALRPMIHRELWTRFGGSADFSTVVLRNHLTLDRGDEGKARYSDQGAEDAIKIFRESLAFAGLDHESAGDLEIDEGEQSSTDDGAVDSPSASQSGGRAKVDNVIQTVIGAARPGERELLSGLLSKEASFRVLVYGKVGPKEIDRLIAKLELDKEILAEPEPNQE